MQFDLASVLSFGKYRGLTIAAVLRFNPGYLAWMRSNMDGISFDEAALNEIRPAVRNEREQSMQRQNGWAWGFGRDVKADASKQRLRTIQIEHEERRKAGQETCPKCFPEAWRSCPACNGVGWVAKTARLSSLSEKRG